MKAPEPLPCPCGSGHSYPRCCGPLHNGTPAATAEALMRSRYTAYVLKLADYLLASWHPSTRPTQLDLDEDGSPPKWLGLEVKRHTVLDADHAQVEFIARYRIGGRAQRLHEISRFVRENGHWFYLLAETEAE